jgi:hypothetical protein
MPSPGTRTIGRGQSLWRLARHIRGVVVHDGTLIVPAISNADTIRPEIVAPPSATTENSPSGTLGSSVKVKGIFVSYVHDALTSLLP